MSEFFRFYLAADISAIASEYDTQVITQTICHTFVWLHLLLVKYDVPFIELHSCPCGLHVSVWSGSFAALLYNVVVQLTLGWEAMHLAATEASSTGLLLEVLNKT